MDSVGSLTVTMGVITFSECLACISYELNGFCFLMSFSADVSNISVLQNLHFVITGTNNLLVDGCHKSSSSGKCLPKFNHTLMLLFY